MQTGEMQKATCQSDGAIREAQSAPDFDALVLVYKPKIFGYALLSLRDRNGAETVTQDCLLRVWQSLHTFRGECSIKTWMMRIAVNLVRDRIRSRRLRFWRRLKWAPMPALDSFADNGGLGRSPEAEAAMRQDAAAVWRAAENLPDRQRTVFLLRFVEEMDIPEIVEATGMKEGTVKTHLFRALRALRAKLGVEL